MNKYRSLENIIRDVARGTAPLSEKIGVMSAIRGIYRKPTESPLAQEPTDKTVDPKSDIEKHIVTTHVSKEIETTLSKALEPGSDIHRAHREYVKRAQRKLKIIDNP